MKSSGPSGRAVVAVYVAAYAAATAFHAADIIRWGLLPYRFAPLPLNIFWTSLVVIDPLVIALLLLGWRRSGIGLALATISADVAVNSYALFGLGYSEFSVSLQLQTAFLGFVLGSAMFIWPSERR